MSRPLSPLGSGVEALSAPFLRRARARPGVLLKLLHPQGQRFNPPTFRKMAAAAKASSGAPGITVPASAHLGAGLTRRACQAWGDRCPSSSSGNTMQYRLSFSTHTRCCPPGRAPRGPQPGQPGPASGLVSTVAQGLESPLASSLSCSVNFSKTSVDFLPCSRILECWGVLWVGGPRCRFCGSLPWLVGTAAPPAPRPPGSVDWPFQRPRGVGGRPTPFLAHR